MSRFRRPGREGALLLGVLALAAFLRFKGLTFQSHWSDELFSALVSDPVRPLEEVYRLTVQDVHPPLYQVLLWWVYGIFGYHEVIGRALSAVAGTVGVFGVYLLGREAFGRRAGQFAALIASMNAFLIYYSQETRSYALLFTLSTFSYLFFVRTIFRPKVGNLLGYVLFTGLAIYTHHFGLCLAGAQGVALLARLLLVSKDRRRLAAYALIAGAVLALSLWPQLDHMTRDTGGRGGWITEPKLSHLRRYFYWYVESSALVVLFSVLLLLAVRRMASSGEERGRREKAALLLGCAVLCFLLAVTVSLTVVPVLSVKNTIIVMPPLIVLVASGVDSFQRDLLRRIVVAGIVLFSAGRLFLEPGYYTTQTKDDWRSVVQEILRSDPEAPIYGARRSGEKLNVYFQWLGPELRASKIEVLMELLHEREAPEFFWMVGPGKQGLAETTIDKVIANARLVELERIERGAVTAFLVRAPVRLLKR